MKIAVVGGGFGGVYAIKALHNCKNIEIFLFEPRERFVFTPLLHEVTVDILHVPSVTHEYETIFRKHMHHIQKKVTHIDLENKYVVAGKKYEFDYVVVSPGSKTWLPRNLPVFQLKTVDDALNIRRQLEKNVLKATKSDDEGLLRCVVVGGGPTGVELAAEIVDYLNYLCRKEHVQKRAEVLLIQSGPVLLKGIDKRVQRAAKKRLEKKRVKILFDTKVADVTKTYVKTKNKIMTQCTIWTAGVVPTNISVNIDKHKEHFPVENTLQIPKYPYAFAIGDASCITEKQLPNLAQVAVQQGNHVGKNIRKLINKKTPKAFKYDDKGFLISLGQKYGAGIVKGVFIEGLFAWVIWRTVYLMKFVGVRSKVRMACEYTKRLFQPR